MRAWIVQEESGFLVVNKPAGILSQKDKSGDDDLAAILQGKNTNYEFSTVRDATVEHLNRRDPKELPL